MNNQETQSGYVFPAWFVNTIVAAIVTTLLAISAYMVRWNADDAAWKARLTERLETIAMGQGQVLERIQPLPVLQHQVNGIERRVERLEEEVRP